MHDSDRYELVRDIGSGNFGVARLMRDKKTEDLVAIKYIERGDKIDENVQRGIINHRSLRHPNIVRFKEVILTPTHLVIVMELLLKESSLSAYAMQDGSARMRHAFSSNNSYLE